MNQELEDQVHQLEEKLASAWQRAPQECGPGQAWMEVLAYQMALLRLELRQLRETIPQDSKDVLSFVGDLKLAPQPNPKGIRQALGDLIKDEEPSKDLRGELKEVPSPQ